jgi:hypothetical protein
MHATAIDAVLNQAFAHHQAGRFAEAEKLYRQVLAARPAGPEIHVGLGAVLLVQDRTDEAAASFRRALEIAPHNADALYRLGYVLLRDGHSDGPVEQSGPGRIAESFACFRRYAELAYGAGQGIRPHEPPVAHKIRHDREQQDYIAGTGADGAKFHLLEGRRLASPAVNTLDAKNLAAQWQANQPELIVIDNLLTPEALENLKRFCWGSTVWQGAYPDGYLISMPEHGFACPLLEQIADEVRAACPAIFQDHLLRYLWAFKYDSTLSGIAIHADPSIITVNFWITADEANLDPEHGGLVIWDTPAPSHWTPAQYNGDNAACRAYLEQRGAKSVSIPYRANRAIIFNSALFHETDRMSFREGYVNRRINVSLLYGVRITDRHAAP